ncbi:hypothetical protein ACFPM7_21675 [Actinokineospora guangxiensis]|uniref:GDSL-like lipase/acylhydrolase family protein n=1 Tax=Actinokineospora guangxiensis TaxID=1490288 RepID=A0ABW0EVQ6_9PSEU
MPAAGTAALVVVGDSLTDGRGSTTAEPTEPAQHQVADDLVAAYRQMAIRAQAHGVGGYGATLTPFGGHGYDDPAGHREAARQQVNGWIRDSGASDALADAVPLRLLTDAP